MVCPTNRASLVLILISIYPLCLTIVTSNEEYHLSGNTTCFGANVYLCYDYVQLDNL